MKTFEELISEIDYPEETNEEVGIRVEVFLNAYQAAENWHRKQLNNLSFQLNKLFISGASTGELIRIYNEGAGGILDDFIY